MLHKAPPRVPSTPQPLPPVSRDHRSTPGAPNNQGRCRGHSQGIWVGPEPGSEVLCNSVLP